MSFLLKHEGREIVVSCCGDCPRNIEVKSRVFLFPPSHHCKDTFDMMFPNDGKVILFPLKIPGWCPHVIP